MKTRGALILLALVLLSPGPARADSFASWAAKAERARKSRDDNAAIGAYTSSLLLWKKSDGKKAKVKVLSGRAELYAKSGEARKALRDLSAALELDFKSPALYHSRGKIHLALSNPSSAISDFYKAVALDLNFKDAYLDRARAYEMQGDIPFAKEDYKTACRLGLKNACALAKTAGKKRAEPPPKPIVSSVQLVKKSAAAPKAAEVQKPAPVVETKPEPAPEAAPPPQAQALAAPPAPSPTPARPDFSACRRGLNACVERGDGFGSCVQKAAACEDAPENPPEGCCPRACVKQFSARVDADESEAQAFREVFAPKSRCAGTP